MQSRVSLNLISSQFASFALTLPSCFNPLPGELQGEPVPLEWLNECELLLIERFGGITITDGFGGSAYSDPSAVGGYVIYREPERRYVVDLLLEQVPEALEWFSLHCPRWAAGFQQRELFLKLTVPDGIWIMRYSPGSLSGNQE